MGASASVWEEIKRKTNAKAGNLASPRNPKTSVRQAASIKAIISIRIDMGSSRRTHYARNPCLRAALAMAVDKSSCASYPAD
jgi:hypothetical protein